MTFDNYMIKPITPQEVIDSPKRIPEEIIKVFNDLIIKNWRGRSSVIKQSEIVNKIVRYTKYSKDEIFANGFLEVEEIFSKAGWEVVYDKPGWNESYEANFEFKKKG